MGPERLPHKMEDETLQEREGARKRGYRNRTLHPSKRAQERYPIEEFPCSRCADPKEGLPHLVDNGSEFYWHHQHEAPGSSARSGCPRFGDSDRCGNRPRPGTATSLWKGKCQGWRMRTEDEYQKALKSVEENGADDAWNREGIGKSR